MSKVHIQQKRGEKAGLNKDPAWCHVLSRHFPRRHRRAGLLPLFKDDTLEPEPKQRWVPSAEAGLEEKQVESLHVGGTLTTCNHTALQGSKEAKGQH